mmetsp:Transcript_22088/g.61906  ORF Transcript_22088/g.61906 Transcript_22088/m.61906 type:complete len:204 (+) Transcript_22088:861-1472(+)
MSLFLGAQRLQAAQELQRVDRRSGPKQLELPTDPQRIPEFPEALVTQHRYLFLALVRTCLLDAFFQNVAKAGIREAAHRGRPGQLPEHGFQVDLKRREPLRLGDAIAPARPRVPVAGAVRIGAWRLPMSRCASQTAARGRCSVSLCARTVSGRRHWTHGAHHRPSRQLARKYGGKKHGWRSHGEAATPSLALHLRHAAGAGRP